MKFTKFVLFLIIVSYSFTAHASYINEDDAVQLVKMNRIANGLDNSAVNFYIAAVDTLTNNEACAPDLTGETDNWLLDNSPKWLVFVDEHPFRSWYHECSYYYMSATVGEDDVVIKKFTGCLPPEENLHKVDINITIDNSRVSGITFPERALLAPGINSNSCTDSTYVVLAANAYFGDYLKLYWNDISVIYKMLTQYYGIEKSHIRIAIGSGIDENGICYAERDMCILSKDLDNDGENETIENAKDNLDAIVQELCDTSVHSDCRHLFIFHDTDNIPIPGSWTNNNYDQVNVGSDKLCYLNIFRNGNTESHTLDPSFNSVITTTRNQPIFDNSIPCQQNIIKWVSALTNSNIVNGSSVNADTNGDGLVSMEEAAYYVDPSNYNFSCKSNSSTLKSVLSFSHYPSSPVLTIRDKDNNSISVSNIVSWASPDIWIRNQNDGMEHQESEHIVNNNDSKYIYVRVHNNSNQAYERHGQKLYLYIADNMPRLAIGEEDSQMLTCIAEKTISEYISANSSAIIEFEIQGLDCSPTFGGIISRDIYAATGYATPDYENTGISKDGLLEKDNIAISKFTKIEPKRGTLLWRHPQTQTTSTSIPIPTFGVELPIRVPRCASLEIINTNSQKNDVNLFLIALRFNYPIYGYCWDFTGFTVDENEEDMLLLTGQNGNIRDEFSNLLFSEEQMVYLRCFDRGMQSLYDKDYEFSLVARDENGEIVGASTYSLHFKGTRGNAGGGIGIMSSCEENDGIELYATNIINPSTIKWYGEGSEVLGESNSLHVNNQEIQDNYIVQAQEIGTGITHVASIDMTQVNHIRKATMNKNTAFIELWRPANNGTKLSISSYDGLHHIERDIQCNTTEIEIPCSSLPDGIYIVNLITDGTNVNSKTIQK